MASVASGRTTMTKQAKPTPETPETQSCPTCQLNWTPNPPVKSHGLHSHFICIECKAVYTASMIAAPDMLAALAASIKWIDAATADEGDGATGLDQLLAQI